MNVLCHHRRKTSFLSLQTWFRGETPHGMADRCTAASHNDHGPGRETGHIDSQGDDNNRSIVFIYDTRYNTYSVLLNANGDYGLTEIAIGSCAPCTSAPRGIACMIERSPSSLRAVWCKRFEWLTDQGLSP